MLIEDNPFLTNMLQHQQGSASAAKNDLASVKTMARTIKDAVPPMKSKPEPASSIVIKVGDVECSAGRKDSHLRTYKPKADVVVSVTGNGVPRTCGDGPAQLL